MQVEIERRFLVASLAAVPGLSKHEGHELIVQGYLVAKDGDAVRVRRRLMMQGEQGELINRATPVLEYKGPFDGQGRSEHSCEIDELMAQQLMRLALGVVQKKRYSLVAAGLLFEVDEFLHRNEGLIVVEVETEKALPASWRPPCWLGVEVTGDQRFANESLAVRPISTWSAFERKKLGLP